MIFHTEKLAKNRYLRLIKELSVFVFYRIKTTRLLQVSSSLTLTTLLSIVPLLAVLIVVFAVFPEFSQARTQVEEFIFSSLLPEVYQRELIKYLHFFSSHAQGLTTVGLVGLLITTLMLFNTIMGVVNDIFEVHQRRPLVKRICIMLGVIIGAPACVAISVGFFKTLMIEAIVAKHFAHAGLLVLHILIQSIIYAFFFKLVPNTSVKFKHAFVGGFFVSVLGLIMKWGFTYYMASSPMPVIYGALAVIPIGMMWIYFTWTLILAGAAITASIPMLSAGRFSDKNRVGDDFITGIAFLKILLDQEEGMSLRQLCKVTNTIPQFARSILIKLEKKHYVREKKNGMFTKNWVLDCDPTTKTLEEVFSIFVLDFRHSFVVKKGAILHTFAQKLRSSNWLCEPMVKSLREKENPIKS